MVMDRVLEPELMDDPKQAEAYARADFSEENQGFVDRFREYFPDFSEGRILDLGCGPADIPIRFAKQYPACQVFGVEDRKSTRLNSSHMSISYAVFCLKKKNKK